MGYVIVVLSGVRGKLTKLEVCAVTRSRAAATHSTAGARPSLEESVAPKNSLLSAWITPEFANGRRSGTPQE